MSVLKIENNGVSRPGKLFRELDVREVFSFDLHLYIKCFERKTLEYGAFCFNTGEVVPFASDALVIIENYVLKDLAT